MKSDLSADREAVLRMEREYWDLVEVGDVDGYLSFWKEGSIAWPPGSDGSLFVDSERLKEQESENVEMYSYEYEPQEVQIADNVAMVYFRASVIEWAHDHSLEPTLPPLVRPMKIAA